MRGPNPQPLQYVKICSLYGAGFYYMPGTDTCIKIGGWVRLQENYNVNGNSSNGYFGGGANANSWHTTDYTTRVRGYITADAREQTEYGTLRSYIAVGTSNDNGPTAGATGATANNYNQTAVLSVNRAFIQFAGFTAGRAVSFFDSANTAALAYAAGAGADYAGGMTTGDAGWTVLAYTAQLGNGLSASISAEDPRIGAVVASGALATDVASGAKAPDLVANLRIDQAWGSAQIAGAVHQVSANNLASTIRSSATGWAISGGLKLNLPMLGKGDYIDTMVNYSEGATRYTSAGVNEGATQGAYTTLAYNFDAVTDATGANMELTKQFSVWAGYQHNWNAQWKTSLWGDYIKTSYGSTANGYIGGGLAGYDASWSGWQIGSRTAWFPVKNLEIGVEVYYTDLQAPTTTVATTSQDMHAWAGQLRIQRNFYP